MARRKMQGVVGGNQLLLQVDDSLAHHQTGFQLEWIKWLCEEIVHTRIHSFEHLMLATLRRQQDRVSVGFIFRALTKAAAKIDAIDFWEDPVEQSQSGRVPLQKQPPRLLAVFCTNKIEAPFFQV